MTELLKYLIDKFATREHFMRAIATLILVVAAYQSIKLGKIEGHWLVLVGTVMGYYFKSTAPNKEELNK